MLEPAYVAWPKTNRYEVKATNRHGNFILLLFHGKYAAARMVTKLIDDEEIEWKNTRTLVTAAGVKITSPNLEELVEHEDNKEEAAWNFTTPNSYYIAQFMRKERPVDIASPRVDTDDEPRVRRAPETPRVDRPDGLVSIQDIAEEIKLDPREARQILRKHAEKPAWGWAWAKDQVAGIKKILKEKRK